MLDLSHFHALLSRHGDHLERVVPGFQIGDVALSFDRGPHLVGVINLSTDSWYKESVCRTADEAIARARKLSLEGARIIDIGAESTLPNARRLTIDEHLELLLPVVRPLAEEGVLVSVESYHPEVLLKAAEAGARIFNLTGTKEIDDVLEVAERFEAAVILCYVQGETVRDVGDFDLEEDMVPVLLESFGPLVARAEKRRVHKVFIDPGLGFYYRNLQDSAKRVTHQIDTFLNAFRLSVLGKPVFNILPHAPEAFLEDERRAAEPFFAVLAALGRTHVIRTHEVDRVSRVLAAMGLYQR
ncbi:MAG: dihydropteroate synthase [Myxococcales bacterium]|nr:dihydropteroate synthase [Myxococcales bacterium]